MAKQIVFISCFILSVLVTGCNKRTEQKDNNVKVIKQDIKKKSKKQGGNFTVQTKVKDVINDSAFKGYGRLIFPADIKIEDDLTLKNIEEILPWYSEINPKRTVEIVNYMKNEVQNGNQIFYDIYTDQEKKEDPDKRNTGLSEVTKHEPPTYECVGTRDGIASYHSVRSYIRKIKKNGTDAEIQVFDGLTHGFGLGEGTVAEGWINEAVRFWERQVK